MRIDVIKICNDAAYIVGKSLLSGCCAFAVVFGAMMAVPAVGVVANAIYKRTDDPESCDEAALQRAAAWLAEKAER